MVGDAGFEPIIKPYKSLKIKNKFITKNHLVTVW